MSRYFLQESGFRHATNKAEYTSWLWTIFLKNVLCRWQWWVLINFRVLKKFDIDNYSAFCWWCHCRTSWPKGDEPPSNARLFCFRACTCYCSNTLSAAGSFTKKEHAAVWFFRPHALYFQMSPNIAARFQVSQPTFSSHRGPYLGPPSPTPTLRWSDDN